MEAAALQVVPVVLGTWMAIWLIPHKMGHYQDLRHLVLVLVRGKQVSE
jgi:hypothetical protein